MLADCSSTCEACDIKCESVIELAIEWGRWREMAGKRLHAVNQVHGNHPIPATHVRLVEEVDNYAVCVALHTLVEPPTANTGVRHHMKHANCQFWR